MIREGYFLYAFYIPRNTMERQKVMNGYLLLLLH